MFPSNTSPVFPTVMSSSSQSFSMLPTDSSLGSGATPRFSGISGTVVTGSKIDGGGNF